MKVKDLIKIIGSISTVLVLIFGISFATALKRFRNIIDAPSNIIELQKSDSIQHLILHDLEHANEYTWDLLRLMTDNHDSTILWKVTDQQGVIHRVDIRETAEGVKLAFVFDYFVVFQIRIDNVDSRLFINVHDQHTGETERYYIER